VIARWMPPHHLDNVKGDPGVTPGKLEGLSGYCVAHHLAKLRQLGEIGDRRSMWKSVGDIFLD
jgi:hypothetical protein